MHSKGLPFIVRLSYKIVYGKRKCSLQHKFNNKESSSQFIHNLTKER